VLVLVLGLSIRLYLLGLRYHPLPLNLDRVHNFLVLNQVLVELLALLVFCLFLFLLADERFGSFEHSKLFLVTLRDHLSLLDLGGFVYDWLLHLDIKHLFHLFEVLDDNVALIAKGEASLF